MANLSEVRDICCGKKYQNKATGEEKTQWTKVGAMFVYDDGRLSIKLDFIPVPDQNGISLAVFKKKTQQRPTRQAPAKEPAMDDLDAIFGPDAVETV